MSTDSLMNGLMFGIAMAFGFMFLVLIFSRYPAVIDSLYFFFAFASMLVIEYAIRKQKGAIFYKTWMNTFMAGATGFYLAHFRYLQPVEYGGPVVNAIAALVLFLIAKTIVDAFAEVRRKLLILSRVLSVVTFVLYFVLLLIIFGPLRAVFLFV
ncbi:MAG: hypothetical protein ACE5J7_05100 [Candidatus Aenigmatarchaeota archaeon]